MKPQPELLIPDDVFKANWQMLIEGGHITPYGQIGDRLWVREAWCEDFTGETLYYKADGGESPGPKGFWRPSIFMPRWASRITLEITGIRAERLQEISHEDAKAEGIIPMTCCLPGAAHYFTPFKKLWDSLNAKRGYVGVKVQLLRYAPGLLFPLNLYGLRWATNPWVWVIEFKEAHDEQSRTG